MIELKLSDNKRYNEELSRVHDVTSPFLLVCCRNHIRSDFSEKGEIVPNVEASQGNENETEIDEAETFGVPLEGVHESELEPMGGHVQLLKRNHSGNHRLHIGTIA